MAFNFRLVFYSTCLFLEATIVYAMNSCLSRSQAPLASQNHHKIRPLPSLSGCGCASSYETRASLHLFFLVLLIIPSTVRDARQHGSLTTARERRMRVCLSLAL